MRRRRNKKTSKFKGEMVHPKKYVFLVLAGTIFIFSVILVVYINIQVRSLLSIHIKSLDNTNVSWGQDAEINILTGYIDDKNIIKTISVISVDKSSVRTVTLPDSLYFNNLQAGTVYAIYTLQGDQDALQKLESSITQSTNIPIDGYVLVKASQKNAFLSVFDPTNMNRNVNRVSGFWAFSNLSTISDVLSNDMYSNFTAASLYTIANFISSGPKITNYSLLPGDTQITDGNTTINTDNFNTDISVNFSDMYMQNEHARVSVYNGSGIDGKAQFLSQVLQDKGEVIDYTGTAPVQDETVIYCSNPAGFPDTIHILQQMLHAKLITKSYSLTSDISVILGKNISTNF